MTKQTIDQSGTTTASMGKVVGRIPTIQTDIKGSILTLTFSNGEEIIVDASKMADHIRENAIMHGLKQKLVDAAAIERDYITGKSATAEDKFEAVREVFERITAIDGATWNKVREGGTNAGTGYALLIRALMDLKGLPRPQVETWFDSLTKEQQSAVKLIPSVVLRIAAIKAELFIGIDAENLLRELGAAMM